jgi:hypothetical protein
MAGVFRFPYQRDSLEPNRKDLALWMDRDRAIEDWISDPSFDLFVTVASDGTGDYTSIKDAIEGVSVTTGVTTSGNVTIWVKPSATDYTDSGRGRVALRDGLRVTVTCGLQPEGRTTGLFGSVLGQQGWIFDGFSVASSGFSFVGFSNFHLQGPDSTWFSGSGAVTTAWFENIYFNGAGSSSQLCQTAGSTGNLRLTITNCSGEDFSVAAPGNVAPSLTMQNCLLRVGLATTSVALTNTAGWQLFNCSTATMPAMGGSGGTILTLDNTFVGGTLAISGGLNFRATGCVLDTLSITMDSNTGEDTSFFITNSLISFLATSSGGSATNNDSRWGAISGCIVSAATLDAVQQASDDHGFLMDFVYTGTTMTISGDSHFLNIVFASDSGCAVTLSGDNNTLFYVEKGSVVVTDTGSGNRVNTLPPSGPAGGDLGGSYPNPTVVNITQLGLFNAKGDLLVATADNTPARLPVGANGEVLRADSTTTEGVDWEPQYDVVDAKGDLIVGTADDTVDNLAVGADGYVLVADSAEPTGLKWAEFSVDSSLNLLSNNQSSLEEDTTGWAVFQDCTIARSTAQASHGAGSLEMTQT